MKIKVRNMTSPNGNTIANQFIITQGPNRYFQSYDTIIVRITPKTVTLDRGAWDCSRTTGKYRNQFLNENKAETQRKIDKGTYKLANLNK